MMIGQLSTVIVKGFLLFSGVFIRGFHIQHLYLYCLSVSIKCLSLTSPNKYLFCKFDHPAVTSIIQYKSQASSSGEVGSTHLPDSHSFTALSPIVFSPGSTNKLSGTAPRAKVLPALGWRVLRSKQSFPSAPTAQHIPMKQITIKYSRVITSLLQIALDPSKVNCHVSLYAHRLCSENPFQRKRWSSQSPDFPHCLCCFQDSAFLFLFLFLFNHQSLFYTKEVLTLFQHHILYPAYKHT